MNILQISPQIPLPLTDGGKKSIFGLTKYFSKQGHKIHFVTYRKHSDYNNSYNELKKYCVPYILDVQTDNNILKAAFNLLSPIPYNISKFYNIEMENFLKEFLLREKIDIVQVHNTHMAWVINVIKKITDIPVILRLENVEMTIMKRYYEMQSNPLLKIFALIQYKKFIKYEPEVCSRFDYCITISSEDEKSLSELNMRIKIKTIPSGVENELLKYIRKKTLPFSIAHVGSLNWFPNLDSLNWFLDEVFPSLILKIPLIKLYIYGSGNYSKLKIPSKLYKNIKIEGFVNNIWEKIEDKSLLVVPLRIGGGIRIKILEMMAFGQNIITTSVGKEGLELVDEEQVLIADSKEKFIEKTLKFFNGEYPNKEMIKNSQRFIEEKYTWEKIIKEFEQLYLTLTKSS